MFWDIKYVGVFVMFLGLQGVLDLVGGMLFTLEKSEVVNTMLPFYEKNCVLHVIGKTMAKVRFARS